MIETCTNGAPGEFKSVLERFTVFYEIYPESVVLRDHSIRQVAYVVDLYGKDKHEPPIHPGDKRCHEVFRGLYKIACWLLPTDYGACHIDIDSFHASLHYVDGWKEPGYMQLGLHIYHLDKLDKPLDTDQKGVLDELIKRLEALGVYHAGDPRSGRRLVGAPA